MAKSFDEIINDLSSSVQGNIGDVDTRSGTVLREAVLSPVATELSEAHARTDEVEANQGISSPGNMSEDAMNRIAANFGLSRFTGSPSSGTVRFLRFVVPPSSILIPAGTVVTTSDGGDALSFETLSSVTLSSTSDQDPVTNAYYVETPAAALVNGVAGNVAADTVRFHTVAGVDECTNPNALSGGKETQSNEELADLIIARAQGNLGTKGGYDSLIRENFSIDDMAIIRPTDEEARRAQFGGALDITLLKDDYIESEETTPETTTTLTPTFLPLIDVTEILGVDASDVSQTLVGPVGGVGSGTDYDVVVDTFTSNGRSRVEVSRIDFHVTSFTPKVSSVFTIRYRNSELVRLVQSFLDNEENEVFGSDVLVKIAIVIPVNAEGDITIIPGNDPTTVQNAAQAAVETHLSTRLLDQDVQASDLTTIIGQTTGVDSVDLSTFKLAKSSSPTTYVPEVVANKQEYISTGTVTINVVG